MKITRIHTRVVTRRSDRPERNPRMAWSEKNVLLVGVETDTGLAGIGECWCDGGSPAVTASLIEKDFSSLLVGQDPRRFARIWRRIADTTTYSIRDGIAFAALSGIDIAIWDLLGKHYGVPVGTLLGGTHDRVFAYASAGLYAQGKTVEDLGREMRGYVEAGFRGVKLKIGGAPFAEDVARVAAAREAVGPGVRLMVDAVYMLSIPEAIRMSRALERHDVYFLEAPVHPDDVDGLAEVARSGPLALAGNEFAYGRAQFKRLLDARAVGFVHMDAIVCGGITEAVRIGSMAESYGRPCSYHAASSVVCFAANLHLAAAAGNCDSIECHMLHRILWDRLPEGLFALDAEGFIVLPDAPGLGLPAGLMEQ